MKGRIGSGGLRVRASAAAGTPFPRRATGLGCLCVPQKACQWSGAAVRRSWDLVI
jgi:hypothetical protein